MNWIKWDTLATPKKFGGLRFRSFNSFNKAILAKQAWRLLHRKNSLMAQVIKARYYPKDDVLTANRGTNSSFLWKSIHTARDVIKERSIWKVGNGEDIKIWEDCWIPASHSGQISSVKPARCTLERVNQLMNPGGKSWNVGRIRRVFSGFDAAKILQIPLTARQGHDQLMWRDNRNGLYSVKSGYRLLRNMQLNQQSPGPSNSNASQLWTKIWSINVLPRCKEMVWRACKEVLPVKVNLKRRGINTETICPCCGEEDETTIHALLLCRGIRRTWFASNLSIHILEDSPQNFLTWQEKILEHPNEDTMASIFNLVWAIWCKRNAWNFEGQQWCIEKTLAKADSIRVRGEQSSQPLVPKLPPPIWTPPPEGCFKLNVDAAIKCNEGTGLGAIIRNSRGQTMAAATWKIEEIEDPALAEAAGIRWALKWAKDICFDQILVETDCLLFCQQWEKRIPEISYLDNVVRECRILSSCFSVFTVSHVKRSCNIVADFLAHLAFTYHEACWLEEDPPGTSVLLSNDVKLAASAAFE